MDLWRRLALLCALQACVHSDNELTNRCASDNDCGERVCAADLRKSPEDLSPLPLLCSERRQGRAQGAACDIADDCQTGVCVLAGACASACESAADCTQTQRCQTAYARTGPGQFARVSACVETIDLPPDAQVLREPRRSVPSSENERLHLPPLAAQTLYVLEHLGDTGWPVPPGRSTCRPPLCARGLREAANPEHVLFDVALLPTAADGPELAVALGKHVNPLTVWAPNGPRLASEPRAYLLDVEIPRAGDLQLTALARSERGARLDLNLYYAGARGLEPEGARGPAPIAAALEELERIFAPADIYVGEVRQTLIAGALLERGADLPQAEASAGFAVLRSQYQVLPQLPELLKLSAGAANVALDVFFVADIDAQGGADVGGIAGGTPVPFGMHGTPGSGVAVATDMFLDAGDPARLGRTLAHELGHALGLFHTSEPDGLVVDALPDTPSCSLAQDSDGSGSLDALECAAHGGDNLMFSTSDAGTQLTAQQRAVLRAALILQ